MSSNFYHLLHTEVPKTKKKYYFIYSYISYNVVDLCLFLVITKIHIICANKWRPLLTWAPVYTSNNVMVILYIRYIKIINMLHAVLYGSFDKHKICFYCQWQMRYETKMTSNIKQKTFRR